jgi:hypothetical protein
MALKYNYKGEGPVSADYAKGGAELTTRSRFLKTPDVFRTSLEQQNYGKKGKGGTLAKTEGETKKLPAVKPRT